jgi:hypothetical protein
MEATEITGLDFDNLGAWFIHLDKTEGIKGLKTWLDAYVATGKCRREWLQETAAELAAMNLLRLAKPVAKAALRCLPMTDLEFCDHSSHANINGWLQKQQRLSNKRRQRIEALLRQAGLTLDWLGEGDDELTESEFIAEGGN